MARKKKQTGPDDRECADESTVYTVGTPLWDKYYQQVRRRVRFPRYYKKALNW